MGEKKVYDREKIISVIIIVVSVALFAGAAVYFIIFGGSFGKENIKMEIMPNITGYTTGDVVGCYSRYFKIDVSGEEYSDYEKGTILSQSVKENEKYVPGKTVVQVVVSAGSKPIETTAPTETTAPAETEPELETGLLVEAQTMDFESAATNDPRELKTFGIDTDNEEIAAKLDEILAVMNPKGCDGGYIYVDLTTGASAEFNADERFSAGSIIKAPFARAVLGGDIDLGAKYEMTEDMLNSSAELIDGQPVGTEFTTEELVKAALEKSDNTAYRMLYMNFGFDGFNELSSSLGVPVEMTEDDYWFRLSTRQTAMYFKDIYSFMNGHKNGAFLMDCMKNAEHNDLVSDELTEYDVCEKYGYLPQNDFYYYTLGSADIVLADNPYMIIVYVRGTGSSPSTEVFHETARLTDDLNKLLHP